MTAPFSSIMDHSPSHVVLTGQIDIGKLNEGLCHTHTAFQDELMEHSPPILVRQIDVRPFPDEARCDVFGARAGGYIEESLFVHCLGVQTQPTKQRFDDVPKFVVLQRV